MKKQKLFLFASIAALAVAAWLNVQPIHSQVIGGGSQVIGGGTPPGEARPYAVDKRDGAGNIDAELNQSVGVGLLARLSKNVPPRLPFDTLGAWDFTGLAAGTKIVKNIVKNSKNTRSGLNGSIFSGTNTTCTVTLADHGFADGTTITVSGVATLTGANKTATITRTDSGHFTYTIADVGGSPVAGTGTGTVSIVDPIDIALAPDRGDDTACILAADGVTFVNGASDSATGIAASPWLYSALSKVQQDANTQIASSETGTAAAGPFTLLMVANADSATAGYCVGGVMVSNLILNAFQPNQIQSRLYPPGAIQANQQTALVDSDWNPSFAGNMFYCMTVEKPTTTPYSYVRVNGLKAFNAKPTGTGRLCIACQPSGSGTFYSSRGTYKIMFAVLVNRVLNEEEIYAAWSWLNNYLQPKGISLMTSEPPLVPYIKPATLATPPMGWMSFQRYMWSTTADIVKDNVDAIKALGLDTLGYKYILPDGIPFDPTAPPFRDYAERLTWNQTAFPDASDGTNGMKVVADYVHLKGLKFGIWNQAAAEAKGSTTALFIGSDGSEQRDAAQLAEYGVDYIKRDTWPSIGSNYIKIGNWHVKARHEAVARMAAALRATGRNVIVNSCTGSSATAYEAWKAGANTARIHSDIVTVADDTNNAAAKGYLGWHYGAWSGIENQFAYYDVAKPLNDHMIQASWTGPGKNYFNDPDGLGMPEYVGGVNKSAANTPAGLTDTEGRTAFSFWCMLAAPLMLSFDISELTTADYTYKTIANTEAIAVDQDSLAWQGIRAVHTSTSGSFVDTWMKPLSDGSWAVMVANRTSGAVTDTAITWASLQLATERARARGYSTLAGSNFSVSGATCTITWTGHKLVSGDKIQIRGLTATGGTSSNANGYFTVTVSDENTITITVSSYAAANGTCTGTAIITTPGMDTSMADYPLFDGTKSYNIRDLWGVTNGTDPVLGTAVETQYVVPTIPSHGCVMYKLTPTT